MSTDSFSLKPSSWVRRFAPLVPKNGRILDIAAGRGRHTALFLERGHAVTAVDKTVGPLQSMPGDRLTIIQSDLETGQKPPFIDQKFAGVVVTNYLHRPLFADILGAVEEDGLLIYETFAVGNERYGRPSNPEFLLRPGELLEMVRGRLRVIAYEDRLVRRSKPARVQRICAINEAG